MKKSVCLLGCLFMPVVLIAIVQSSLRWRVMFMFHLCSCLAGIFYLSVVCFKMCCLRLSDRELSVSCTI